MARNRKSNQRIQEVWASNLDAELLKLEECIQFFSILSVDTEFPGHIRNSPQASIDRSLYEDFRFNVNETKLIQLGLTASDDSGRIGGSWEFNFSDFDPETDEQNPCSVSFLKNSGLDLNKLKKFGIPIHLFRPKFFHIIRKQNVFRWVTFHGLYDIGYLMKAMGILEVLPESMEEFAMVVVRKLGIVRDLKHMARLCEGLEDGKLGLEKLGKLLDQTRHGQKHNAGSDSLLTASAHFEMIRRFEVDWRNCDGYLYGFSNQLQAMEMKMKMKMKMYYQKMITLPQIPPYAIYCYAPPSSYLSYY